MPSTTPLCRCRVLYIGSAVPLKSKDGLQGIQEPLRQLYPIDSNSDTKGVDSWLSVWVNGIVLEYVEEERELFFPIQTLHYCAAVRYVNVAGYALEGGGEKFLPLDSPFANLPDTTHPPIFAAILRRTQGVKVLECHAFICTNAKAANALVRCCFHAYADSMYLGLTDGQMGDGGTNGDQPEEDGHIKAIKDKAEHGGGGGGESSRSSSPDNKSDLDNGYDDSGSERAGKIAAAAWHDAKMKKSWQNRQQTGDYDTASISSSLAGKYKKKEGSPQKGGQKEAARPPSVAASYSNALVPVPMQWQQQQQGRRARSEMDLHMGTMSKAVRPYAHSVSHHPGMMPPPHARYPGPPPPMMMPPPRFMGPMGPPGHPHGMPHPPFMPGGPPPGAMHGMPPPFMRGPPPPPQFMGPPPPGAYFGPPPPPGMGMSPSPFGTYSRAARKSRQQHRSPEPMPASLRGRPRAFEEPAYLPGHMLPPPPGMHHQGMPPGMHPQGMPPHGMHPQGMPPHGMHPQGMPPHGMQPQGMPPGGMPYPGMGHPDSPPFDDYYYYDSYDRRKQQKTRSRSNGVNGHGHHMGPPPGQGQGRRSPSSTSSRHRSDSGDEKSPPAPDYWDSSNVYESGLFKRQHLNEKAFSNSIKRENKLETTVVSVEKEPPPHHHDNGNVRSAGGVELTPKQNGPPRQNGGGLNRHRDFEEHVQQLSIHDHEEHVYRGGKGYMH